MRKALVAVVVSATAVLPLAQASTALAAPTYSPIAKITFNPDLGFGSASVGILPDGHLLATDSIDGIITEMNADGSGQHVWATGLQKPTAIAIDATNHFVYVSEAALLSPQTAGKVERFSLTGTGRTTYGTGYGSPSDVTVSGSGAVVVADPGAVHLPKPVASQVWIVTGSTPSPNQTSLSLPTNVQGSSPNLVATDPTSGRVYVADQVTSSIYKLSADLANYTYFARTWLPDAMTISGDSIYMVDAYTQFYVKSGLNLEEIDKIALSNGARTALSEPLAEGSYSSIAVDGANVAGMGIGELFLGKPAVIQNPQSPSSFVDQLQILAMSPDASTSQLLANSGGGSYTHFARLTSASVNGQPTIFAVDETNGQVLSMHPDGTHAAVVVAGYQWPYYPQSVAVDAATGNVYVLETVAGGQQIERFGPTGGLTGTGTVVLAKSDLTSGAQGITFDSVSNQLFIALGSDIVTTDPDGTNLATFVSFATAFDVQFPTGVDLGSDGKLYASVSSQNGISYAQGFTITKGSPGTPGPVLPFVSGFVPAQVTLDGQGRLFAAGTGGGLAEVSTDGISGQVLDNTTGVRGVTVDASGNLITSTSSTISTAATSPLPVITALSRHHGPRGGSGTIVITGTNLTGATAVYLSGSGASNNFYESVFSGSSTQASINLPDQLPGTYDLRIQTPGGLSAINVSTSYTIDPTLPTVTMTQPNSGSVNGGTTVNLYGKNLTGATGVTFGGVAATNVVVHGDSYLTATAPAYLAGGTVHIIVTTPVGSAAPAATDQFTYTGAPPSVTSVTPASGPRSGGTPIVIHGHGFIGALSVHFGGTTVLNFHVTSDTAISVNTPAVAVTGTVDVRVTTAAGTTAVTGVDHFTFTAPAATVTSLGPIGGPLGGSTIVTIKGTNLAGVNKVTVGGATVAPLLVNATTVQFKTPAHGFGPSQVTLKGNGAGLPLFAGIFHFEGAPIITVLNHHSVSHLVSMQLVISGANLYATSRIIIGAVSLVPLSINAAGTQVVVMVPPHVKGTFVVKAQTPAGISAAIGAVSTLKVT